MPWDTDFSSEPVSDRHPEKLIEDLDRVIADPDLRLDNVTLSRKRRDRPKGKVGKSFHKFSNYRPDLDTMTAEEISSILVGAAIACRLLDGDLASPKFQATITWVAENGTKERCRTQFDLDEIGAHVAVAASRPTCDGCAARQDIIRELRGLLREERARAMRTAERLDAAHKSKDEVLGQFGQFVRDVSDDVRKQGKQALETVTSAGEIMINATEAAKPNENVTRQTLGVLEMAVNMTKGVLEEKTEIVDQIADQMKEQGRQELAREGLKVGEKIVSTIVKAKFGAKMQRQESNDDTKKGEHMKNLIALRDSLFEVATEKDWAAMRSHLGDEIADAVLELKAGELTVERVANVVEKIEGVPDMKVITLIMELSERTGQCIMALSQAYDLAKAEQEQSDQEPDT